MSIFAGGVAVVTGAGSGLGASMVERFAGAGMKIAALDIDGVNAEATAAKVRAAGGEAIGLQVDVANRTALDAAAAEVERTFGAANILAANVGVQQFGAVDRLTEQDWRWVLDVNVMGVIHSVGAFLPLLRRSTGEKRILLTSSSAALTPGIRMAAYTTSKYAVTGYGETLRMELAPEAIGVSILFPAGMITRHLESSKLARPADLGPTEVRREDIDAMMASRGMTSAGHTASAEHATRHLIADLGADARYIITHGDYADSLEANHADVMQAHARAQED